GVVNVEWVRRGERPVRAHPIRGELEFPVWNPGLEVTTQWWCFEKVLTPITADHGQRRAPFASALDPSRDMMDDPWNKVKINLQVPTFRKLEKGVLVLIVRLRWKSYRHEAESVSILIAGKRNSAAVIVGRSDQIVAARRQLSATVGAIWVRLHRIPELQSRPTFPGAVSPKRYPGVSYRSSLFVAHDSRNGCCWSNAQDDWSRIRTDFIHPNGIVRTVAKRPHLEVVAISLAGNYVHCDYR